MSNKDLSHDSAMSNKDFVHDTVMNNKGFPHDSATSSKSLWHDLLQRRLVKTLELGLRDCPLQEEVTSSQANRYGAVPVRWSSAPAGIDKAHSQDEEDDNGDEDEDEALTQDNNSRR